jgi:hypothetical protein
VGKADKAGSQVEALDAAFVLTLGPVIALPSLIERGGECLKTSQSRERKDGEGKGDQKAKKDACSKASQV